MRGSRRFLAALAALAAFPCPARGASTAMDRLRQLLNSSDVAADQRRRVEEQLRRIQERRDKKIAEERKEAKKTSLEAVKQAFEKGKKAYEEQLYSLAYLHFSAVASCGLTEAAKMAAEARTRTLEIEGMARAKYDRAELLVLRGEAAEAAKAFLEIVQDFPYGDAAKRAKSRLLALRTTPAVAASLRYAEGKAQEDAENYGQALKVYDEVVQRWPDEIAALRAKVAAKRIREDPDKLDLARQALELEAERACPTVLNLAKNYLINNDAATARAKLDLIIQGYPGTSYAEQATAVLEALADGRAEVAKALLDLEPGSDDGAGEAGPAE